jgi:hypothetical protein
LAGPPAARFIQWLKVVLFLHIFHRGSQVAVEETSRHQSRGHNWGISEFSSCIHRSPALLQEIIQKTTNCDCVVCQRGGTLKVTTPLANYFFYPQLELSINITHLKVT